MSEQETPAWHAIVGKDWEPVLFGEMAGPYEHVLEAQGWVEASDGGGFIYQPGKVPRRRRKRLFEIRTRIGVAQYCCIKGVKAGDRFMLVQNGQLVKMEDGE